MAVVTNTHPGFVGVTPLVHTVGTTGTTKGGVATHLICANSSRSGDLRPSLFASLSVPHPSMCLRMSGASFFRQVTNVLMTFTHRLRRRPTRMMLMISSLAPAVTYSVMTGGGKVGITRLITKAHSFSVSVPGRIGDVVASNLSSCLFATKVMTGHGLGRAKARRTRMRFMKGVLVSALHCGHAHLRHPMTFSVVKLGRGRCLLLALGGRSLLGGSAALGTVFHAVLRGASGPVITPLRACMGGGLSTLKVASRELCVLPPRPCLSFKCLIGRT